MLRTIFEWLISRSIDQDRPLPDWLKRRVDRDDDLKQFEVRSRQLGDRLRVEAADWIASGASAKANDSALRRQIVTQHRNAPGRGRQKIVWTLLAGSMAAMLVFAVFQLGSPGDRVARLDPGRDPHLAKAPPVKKTPDPDHKSLVRWLKDKEAKLGQLRSRMNELPSPTEDWKLPDVSVIVEPAKAAGSSAGHALAILDRGVESEQQLLKSELQTAFSFFAYRLPTSVAKLVGWKPPA